MLLEKKIEVFDKQQTTGYKSRPIDIKKAVDFVAKAWDNVTPTTITNCWKKTGIIFFEANELLDEGIENESNIITSITSQQQRAIQSLIDSLSVDSPLSATDYITIDDFLLSRRRRGRR